MGIRESEFDIGLPLDGTSSNDSQIIVSLTMFPVLAFTDRRLGGRARTVASLSGRSGWSPLPIDPGLRSFVLQGDDGTW